MSDFQYCPHCQSNTGKVLMMEISPGIFRCPFCKHEENHGRYWKTLTQDQRSAFGAPSDAGRGNALPRASAARDLTIADLRPGAITYISVDPSLSFSQSVLYAAAQKYINQQMAKALSPGLLGSGEAPKPDLCREMQVGEIVGYRWWRLRGGMLKSVWQHDYWQPGETMVGSGLEDWDKCGVHAWKDPTSQLYRQYINWDNDVYVCGSVYLWGDVVEHEHGYRAEFAKVRSLDWLYHRYPLGGGERFMLDELRKLYGV